MTYEERIQMRMAAYFADNHIQRTQDTVDEYRLGVILAQNKNAVGAKLDRLYEELSFETEAPRRKAILSQMAPLAPEDVDVARELASFNPDRAIVLNQYLALEAKENEALSAKEGLDLVRADGHLHDAIPARGYLRLVKALMEEEADQGNDEAAIMEGERILTLDRGDALGMRNALALLYLKSDDEEKLDGLASSFPEDKGLILALVGASRLYLTKAIGAAAFAKLVFARSLWFYLLLTHQIEFAEPLRNYLAALPEAKGASMEEALYAYALILTIYGEDFASFPCFPFYEKEGFIPIAEALSPTENAILSLIADWKKPVGPDEISAVLAGKKPAKRKSYLNRKDFGSDPTLTPALALGTLVKLLRLRMIDVADNANAFIPSSCLGSYLHFLRLALAEASLGQ
jgi:hypothetical protein